MQAPSRFTNFSTQFFEDEGLAAFENWLIYLDYQYAKNANRKSQKLKEMSIDAINGLLPHGARYDSIDANGRIFFDINGAKVPTFALSDGYRSVLALSGDLVWRLISTFPDSSEPFKAKGVVLIDELDIHLHPVWQRDIAGLLRSKFPNLQFIVTTHSPMVAAGAGSDALTLRVSRDELAVLPIGKSLFAMDVEDILKSEAFGLVSTYSPEAQLKIDKYSSLLRKGASKTPSEKKELEQLSLFFNENNPYGIESIPTKLEQKIDAYLSRKK
jgi:predicted ATP-binding protein involved in virulence